MDPLEQLLFPEAPDLNGEVAIVSYRPVFAGPYSCVYRGKLRQDSQMVAIKVLNTLEGASLHKMRRKLNREVRTWGALNHPNILPLYGFADDEELFQPLGALISPWMQRGDASKYLAEYGGSLTTNQGIQLWEDVLCGVEHLHSHKPLLVHSDLKPRNILIDDLGRALLGDFGLVRIFMDEGNSGMTTTTHHTGTQRYLAYELVMAGEEAIPTTASDIYAVGCAGLEFIFSQMPHPTRSNEVGGGILFDIKAAHLDVIGGLLGFRPRKATPCLVAPGRLRDPLFMQQPTPTSSFQPGSSSETRTSFTLAESGLPVLPPSPTSVSQDSIMCEFAKSNFLSGTRSSQRLLLEKCINSSWLRNHDPEPGDSQNQSVLLGFLQAENPNDRITCLFDDCVKTFETHDRALGHVRMHLGHRPYPCNGQCQDVSCRNRFSCHSVLRAHISAKQLACPRCETPIFRKNMKRHQQKCKRIHAAKTLTEPPT